MDKSEENKAELVRSWALALDDMIERHSSIESRQRETVRLRCGGELFGFYHFTDEQIDSLLDLAETEPDAFDVAKREAARRLAISKDIPERLYSFVIGVLSGELEKPRKKPAGSDDYLRVLVMRVVEEIQGATGWPRYHDQATKQRDGYTACDVVANALKETGHEHRPRLEANQINGLFLRGRLKKFVKKNIAK